MHIHTYRVRSLAEAIRVVREELGPDAALLHTRRVGSPLLGWLGGRTLEVTASADANVPSRLPPQAIRESAAGEGNDFRQMVLSKLPKAAAAGLPLSDSLPEFIR